jgi:ATP-dependent Zn protease
MTQTNETVHPHKPWWSRIPRALWIIVIAVVLIALIVAIVEKVGKPSQMPYSAFLDQLEVGNVATITFQGTEIDGHFKRPLDATIPTGTAQRDTFSSRVPEIGDAALIPELRKQHVVIDVQLATQWTRLLAGLPWPMLLFVGFALIAGLIRLVRGGKVGPALSMPMHPMQGMVGVVSGLFKGRNEAVQPPTHDAGESKSR